MWRYVLAMAIGIPAGLLFAWIVGALDAADYLVEQLSIGVIEVPFAVAIAAFVRIHGWRAGSLLAVCGTAAAVALAPDPGLVTAPVFAKTALTGLALGMPFLLGGSFTRRLAAVAAPGIILGLVFGLPIALNGVDPAVVDRIRNDALEMYRAFMTDDQARNTADNAMEMFRAVFTAGLSVYVIGAILWAWVAFHAAGIVFPRLRIEPEAVTAFREFSAPFHAVWVFLGAFGLLLSEWAPAFPFALNGFIIMAVLYLLQGLAVVMYHMDLFGFGRLPRVLFWLVLFITIGFTGILLLVLGTVDNWLRFRERSGNRMAGERVIPTNNDEEVNS